MHWSNNYAKYSQPQAQGHQAQEASLAADGDNLLRLVAGANHPLHPRIGTRSHYPRECPNRVPSLAS